MSIFKKISNKIGTFATDLILYVRIRSMLKKCYAMHFRWSKTECKSRESKDKFDRLLAGLFRTSKAIEAEIREKELKIKEDEDLKLTNEIKAKVEKHFYKLNMMIRAKDLEISRLEKANTKMWAKNNQQLKNE